MTHNRFPNLHIVGILDNKDGTPVLELCRKLGVSDASICKWKAKFGRVDVPEAKRVKMLKTENAKLMMRKRGRRPTHAPHVTHHLPVYGQSVTSAPLQGI